MKSIFFASFIVSLAMVSCVAVDGFKFPSSSSEGGYRRSKPQMIEEFRKATMDNFVGQDLAVERALYSYRDPNGKGCLVVRPVGPSGTGKTSFACFMAHSMFFGAQQAFNPAICLNGHDGSDSNFDMGPYVISKTFQKDGPRESQVLDLFNEANKKLEQYPDGILIILNDYNLAGEAVWAFMSAFVKQDNMKNSVLILTDDLTTNAATEYKKTLEIKLTASTLQEDALEIILDETKRVFPKVYQQISDNDVWIPFLPFPIRAIETLIHKICKNVDHTLRTDMIQGKYFGRLLCDMKSREQAAIKLRTCVDERGARVLNAFQEAFQQVLSEKAFCPDSDESSDWVECVTDADGLPLKSIVFQVDPTVEQSTDCSQKSMQAWMSFRLFDMSCNIADT